MAKPNMKDLILFINKALDGNTWNNNWQKLVNWLTDGKSDLKIKSLEISAGGGINNNGSLVQNGNLTVSGDLEANNIKANGYIEGDGSKLYNLQTQGVQAFTPFTINKGHTTSGKADLISATPVTEGGDIVKFTIDFLLDNTDTYGKVRATTADGDTFELDHLVSDELAANNTFYYFIGRGQNAPIRLTDVTIYRQPTPPSASINDIWLDTSTENLVCKKLSEAGIWEKWDYVPLGKVTIADINTDHSTATVETFAYNQNGYNVNTSTSIFGVTAYAINSLIDKSADDVGTVYGPFTVPYLVQVGLIVRPGKTNLFVSSDGTNWVKVIDVEINYDDGRIDTDMKSIVIDSGLYFKFTEKGASVYGGSFVFKIAPLYPPTL